VNVLLRRGDRIALAVPTFPPYIEIPRLERYGFEMVEIRASEMRSDGSHNWQYPEQEINRLLDPEIKALFLVNPSNPPSIAMSAHTLNRIVDVVLRNRPDLIVITDDVYAPFISGFRSLFAAIPYNTVCLYSFSKYFGCTGWRLGVIALHESNILDDKIAALKFDQRVALAQRYSSLTPKPEKLKFIDRLVADSRQVALNHTAGLSTPQQIQMALFALSDLLDRSSSYRQLVRGILQRRLRALWNGLGATVVDDPLRAGYYAELDLLVWAQQHHGADFVRYLKLHCKPFDLLYALAKESSIVLMPGSGFEGPEWSVRVSLANLPEDAYESIGKSLRQIAESYVDEWRAHEKPH
jgi:aspartate 4-decarboxylase